MKKIFVLLLSIFLLAGCVVKQETTSIITENKNVSFTYVITVDKELLETIAGLKKESIENKSDEEKINWLRDLYKEELNLKKYEDNNYLFENIINEDSLGVKITIDLGNIDSLLNNTVPFTINDLSDLKNKNLFSKLDNTYSLVIRNEENPFIDNYIEKGLKKEAYFILKLPVKASTNNATKVSEDKKTLTWDLSNVKTISADFEFKEDLFANFINIIESNIYLSIAVIAGIFILFILMLVGMSNKKEKNNNKLDKIQSKTLNPKSFLNVPNYEDSDKSNAEEISSENMDKEEAVNNVQNTVPSENNPVEYIPSDNTPKFLDSPVILNDTDTNIHQDENSFKENNNQVDDTVIDAFNQTPTDNKSINNLEDNQ